MIKETFAENTQMREFKIDKSEAQEISNIVEQILQLLNQRDVQGALAILSFIYSECAKEIFGFCLKTGAVKGKIDDLLAEVLEAHRVTVQKFLKNDLNDGKN